MNTVEEKIKSLSIEERAVEREKHILSHAVDTDDVKHLENLWGNDPRWAGITRPYSVEHNHWHDAPSIPTSTTPSPLLNELQPQPQGAAPPGKVWSPEHGHWHDKQ